MLSPRLLVKLATVIYPTKDSVGGCCCMTKIMGEWDVDGYQNQYSFVWKYGKSSLIDIVKQSEQKHQCILDVGCGTGELTNELSAVLSDSKSFVIGIDSDPGMIDKAKYQFPHITFKQADARDINLFLSNEENQIQVSTTFDVVFSNAALHWIPRQDIDQAIGSMASLLKENGQFIVEFGGKGNVESVVQACQNVLREKGISYDCPWYFPSISEFTNVLEMHGIEVTSAELYYRPTPLEGGEMGMRNWIRMFGGHFLKSLKDNEIDGFLDTVCHLLSTELYDGNQWIADYRRIRVIGRKMS